MSEPQSWSTSQGFDPDSLYAVVAKMSLPSVLLWYSAIAALVTSLGAWIIFLTGQLYLKLEPAEEEVLLLPLTDQLNALLHAHSRIFATTALKQHLCGAQALDISAIHKAMSSPQMPSPFEYSYRPLF